MNYEILKKAWDLHDSIDRAKNDLDMLEKLEFIQSHRCSREKTKEEIADEDRIKTHVRNILKARLTKLEQQFKKL